MSLKQVQRLDEGPFDFIRGAAGEAKRKVANSAPVRVGKEIVQAGRNASAAAELEKEIMALAQLVAATQPQQRTEPTMSKPVAQQPAPAQAARQPQPAPKPGQTTQRRSPSTQTTQAPSAFRSTTKPRGTIGPLGKDDFRYTFDSYLQAVYGEELTEGAMDFIRGAGSAAMSKVSNFIKQYGEQPSVLKDIYNAGKDASAQANQAKQQQAAQERMKQASEMAARIKQKIQQMGPQGAQLVQSIVAKLPQNVRQPVVQALGA